MTSKEVQKQKKFFLPPITQNTKNSQSSATDEITTHKHRTEMHGSAMSQFYNSEMIRDEESVDHHSLDKGQHRHKDDQEMKQAVKDKIVLSSMSD